MWLYEGKPELVGVKVPDASAQDGGYIMVFVLESGPPRIVATRFPAKNITSWKSRAARYGGENLDRVLVSPPHPRYEKIKRLLAAQLSFEEDGTPHPGPLTLDHISTKVNSLFSELTPDFGHGGSNALALNPAF